MYKLSTCSSVICLYQHIIILHGKMCKKLYFQPVKKSNLNRGTSPCDSSPNYNFADCIEDKSLERVGCRPFWINNTRSQLPLCQQPSQYLDHFNRRWNAASMNLDQIYEEFGCLRPCTYMEYKVRALEL